MEEENYTRDYCKKKVTIKSESVREEPFALTCITNKRHITLNVKAIRETKILILFFLSQE